MHLAISRFMNYFSPALNSKMHKTCQITKFIILFLLQSFQPVRLT